MSSKNILLLIPNLDFGGAQRSLLQLANELSKHHKVQICTFNTEHGVSYPFEQKVLDLQVPAGTNWFMKVYRFYQRYRRLKRIKRQSKIQTTISYLEGANYLNILTQTQDRVVISVRGSKLYDETIVGWLKHLRLKLFIPYLYRKAHQIVALNRGIKKELTGLGLDKSNISVIRNFYEISEIESQATQATDQTLQCLFGQYKVLVYNGRLAAGKGLRHIIRIYKQLLSSQVEVRLLLIGEGPFRSELKHYAETLGLRVGTTVVDPHPWEHHDILALGYQNNPYQFIKNCDVLLIASSSEGGPNALYESMICKTLVVSTDCPYGPRELLTDDQLQFPINQVHWGTKGLLLPMFEYGNLDEIDTMWVNTIKGLLVNPEQGVACIKQAYDWVLTQDSQRLYTYWSKVI